MQDARFVLDSSLQALARRLRAIGYDVAVLADAPVEAVCRAARLESRTLITTSRRVPRACAWVPRVVVPRGDDVAAVRVIADRFHPSGPPFGRCIHCNVPLERDVSGCGSAPVPPPAGVAVTGRCPACGRCYWHGSHVDRMLEWFARELGLRLSPPGGAS